MANPLKGEVEFTVEGTTYRLVLDANALATAENILDRPVKEFDLERIATIRALLFGGLQSHHPDVDLFGAGRLISAAPDVVGTKVGEALRLAFPAPEKGARPRKAAKGGTGARS